MISPARFVEFLVDRRYIPPRAALELEDQRFPLIGLLAVQHGYLSWARVQEVLAAQRSSARPFGELAVSMGHLDEEQLQGLLEDQEAQVDLIERVLVGGRYVTRQQFRQILDEFEELCREERSSPASNPL